MGAAQRQQALSHLGDQEILDGAFIAATRIKSAANGIVNEAESILTDASVCQWADDTHVHALRARIAHYLSDHPRLTDLKDALDLVPPLLDELKRRANRRLQRPNTRAEKQQAAAAAVDALSGLEQFVGALGSETQYLPSRTGIAAIQLSQLEAFTQFDQTRRVAQQDEIDRLVTEGRLEVQESRTNRAAASLDAALNQARIAFA